MSHSTHSPLETAARFELLREIFALAREQRAALEHDEIDRFQALMDEREDLLARLAGPDGDWVPENVVAFRSPLDDPRQDALALDTLIRGILEHDAGNEALLRTKLEVLRSELPQLRKGRRAAASYRQPGEAAGYIDRRS